MSNEFTDSLAAYASAADIQASDWQGSGANLTIQTTGGRFGAGAVRSGGTSAAETLARTLPGAGRASRSCGFVVRPISGTLANNSFWIASEASTAHISIGPTAGGVISVYRGDHTTLLGSSSRTLTLGVDYVIEIEFTINDTTGVVKVWIDGVLEINLSAQDTRNGGTSGVVDNYKWLSTNGNWDFSEIYGNNTDGSAPNNGAWINTGPYRIECRRATAAGNYAQFTPLSSTNVSNVDDTHGNDGDTTYNAGTAAGNKDTFQFGSITPTAGTIPAIATHIMARKTEASGITLRAKQRQSGADQNYTTTAGVTIAYRHFTEVKETNPSTSAAFTVSEMRSTSPEFGYERVA